MKSSRRYALTLALVLPCTSSASGVLAGEGTLPKDPSFEEQLTPEEGGWQLFGGVISAKRARTGKRSMANFAFRGTSGSFQQLPARPGSKWRLTGYALTPSPLQGTPAFGVIQLSFFDANGKDLGTVESAGEKYPALTSKKIQHGAPANEWIFLDTGVGTAPEGTASIQVFTLYVDYSYPLQGAPLAPLNYQGVFFDDLRVCELATGDDGADCRT